MKAIYLRIQELGGEVLAVSFSPPQRLLAYLEKYPLPFPVVSDPDRAAYRGLGLDKTSWKEIFRPRVLARYFLLMFRGWLPKSPAADDDLMQLGGDFILDRQKRLVYAHPSSDPTDRPSAEELLREMERCCPDIG